MAQTVLASQVDDADVVIAAATRRVPNLAAKVAVPSNPACGGSPLPISDPNDQPILDAAPASAVGVIVTGDKAFLSLTLEQPRTMTARAFLDAYSGNA